MKRPRKIIIRVLEFLLLGAIVNVAVAWGSAVLSPSLETVKTKSAVRASGIDGPSQRVFAAFIRKGHGVLAIDVFAMYSLPMRLEDTELTEEEFRRELSESRQRGIREVPRWSAIHSSWVRDLPQLSEFSEWISDRAYGWPMLGLSHSWLAVPDLSGLVWHLSVREGLVIGETTVAFPPPPRDEAAFLRTNHPTVLPLSPIWPGFAINTLFYAAILWLLLFAPGALRKRRRIQRGLCPACAYPVGSSPVCTECGQPVPLASVQKPPPLLV